MSASSKTGSKPRSTTKTKKTTTKSATNKVKKSTTKKKATAKSKTVKTGKTRTVAKSVKEKQVKSTLQINDAIVEKTLASIERLGEQTFAFSPFSQYYDDWLLNLRQAVAEFGTCSNVKVNESFSEKCEQVLSDIHATLTDICTQESALGKVESELLKVKQDLEELESDYAKQKQELSSKQNAEIEQLTVQIKTFENDIESQGKVKFGFFQFNAKKVAAKKLEQTKQSLKEAKTQLETASQNSTAEQSKLQDDYETKKQELTTKSDALRKETETLEIDISKEVRKETCTRLTNILNEQIKQ
ncbi:MAG: hypothetical protein LBB87_00615 [Nitrososphaerota archaeon]|nr:hypothetical protein [Nitrososphaerota archaeon]